MTEPLSKTTEIVIRVGSFLCVLVAMAALGSIHATTEIDCPQVLEMDEQPLTGCLKHSLGSFGDSHHGSFRSFVRRVTRMGDLPSGGLANLVGIRARNSGI